MTEIIFRKGAVRNIAQVGAKTIATYSNGPAGCIVSLTDCGYLIGMRVEGRSIFSDKPNDRIQGCNNVREAKKIITEAYAAANG